MGRTGGYTREYFSLTLILLSEALAYIYVHLHVHVYISYVHIHDHVHTCTRTRTHSSRSGGIFYAYITFAVFAVPQRCLDKFLGFRMCHKPAEKKADAPADTKKNAITLSASAAVAALTIALNYWELKSKEDLNEQRQFLNNQRQILKDS